MEREGRSTKDSFERTQEFLTQHPFADSPADLGAQARELDEVIAGLNDESLEQEASTRNVAVLAQARDAAREELYKDHMRPIAVIAREVFGRTGTDRAFRLPRSWASNQPLLAAAGAMADAADRAKDTFVARGMPADFVDQLRAAARRLDDVRQGRTESARRRVTSTAKIDDLLRRGRSAVRQLDGLLRPRLAKDPALLRAWESATRVRPTSAAGSPEPAAAPEIQKVA